MKRRWARYVSLGALDLAGLVDAARKCGMLVVQAFKPDWHFHYEIQLWGTASQMAATEGEWSRAERRHEDGSVTSAGEVARRRPPGTFGVDLQLPRDRWVDQ